MTPERLAQLQARMALVMDREVRELVRAQMSDELTSLEVSQAMAELSEIGACIGTSFRALNMWTDTATDVPTGDQLSAALRASIANRGKRK